MRREAAHGQPAQTGDPGDLFDLFDQVRGAAATVAAMAQFVHIDGDEIARLADELCATLPRAAARAPSPAHPYRRRDEESTLAFVITFDAINFGSGWFPALHKRLHEDGSGRSLSGARTITANLADWFDTHGPWSCHQLAGIEASDVARVLGQDGAGAEAFELMEHMADAWRELGRHMLSRHDGSFRNFVVSAQGDAARLVEALTQMSSWRDVTTYRGGPVPLLKRAQITVADLHRTLGPAEPFGFAVDRLTMFADNLVPHVLRVEGALRYDGGLAERIDREELLLWGSAEEVEIRACALHAVELLCEELRDRGRNDATPMGIDELLWERGQEPRFKAIARHRCRCRYY